MREHKEHVVLAQGGDRSELERADAATAWKYLFIVGTGLTVVGLIDLALVVFPARVASLDWEFGTISGVVDGLPLVTLGMGIMSAAAAANGWVLTRRLMMVLTLLMAVMIGVITLVYALDMPAVLKAVEPAMKPSIKRAGLKTGLMSLTFFALYLALGLWTWRRLRVKKGARG